jgi:hypothetical protein
MDKIFYFILFWTIKYGKLSINHKLVKDSKKTFIQDPIIIEFFKKNS